MKSVQQLTLWVTKDEMWPAYTVSLQKPGKGTEARFILLTPAEFKRLRAAETAYHQWRNRLMEMLRE